MAAEEEPAAEVVSGDLVTTVRLRGEFDVAARAVLLDALTEALSGSARSVCMELSGVSFIDAGSVGALMTAWRRLSGQGRRLEVVGAVPRVFQVFQVLSVADRLAVAPLEEPAPPR